MRCYSGFWLAFAAGLVCLSPDWAERDARDHPVAGEELSMDEWLRLKEHQRVAVVASYAPRRRPQPRYQTQAERRQGAA